MKTKSGKKSPCIHIGVQTISGEKWCETHDRWEKVRMTKSGKKRKVWVGYCDQYEWDSLKKNDLRFIVCSKTRFDSDVKLKIIAEEL